MKHFLIGLVSVMVALAPVGSYAQTAKEQRKERQEVSKFSKKELNEKATKAARKEAKRLAKEGWRNAPGALPIEKQLDKSYLMQYMYDSDGAPQYIMGEGMSIGGNYDSAKMQALELAKQQVISKIESEIALAVENEVSNSQMSSEQAASVAESVSRSKSLAHQKLSRILPVVELYRTLPNKNKEVLVHVAYDMNSVREIAKRVVQEDLRAKGANLGKQVDEMIDK